MKTFVIEKDFENKPQNSVVYCDNCCWEDIWGELLEIDDYHYCPKCGSEIDILFSNRNSNDETNTFYPVEIVNDRQRSNSRTIKNSWRYY